MNANTVLLCLILVVLLLGRRRFLGVVAAIATYSVVAAMAGAVAYVIATVFDASSTDVTRAVLLTAGGVFVLCVLLGLALNVAGLFGWSPSRIVGRAVGLTERQLERDAEFEREFAEAWKRGDSKAVQEVMRRQLAWEAGQTPGVDPPSDKDGSAPS